MKKSTALLAQTLFGMFYLAMPILFMLATWKTYGFTPSTDPTMLIIDCVGMLFFAYGAFLLWKCWKFDPVIFSDNEIAKMENDVEVEG